MEHVLWRSSRGTRLQVSRSMGGGICGLHLCMHISHVSSSLHGCMLKDTRLSHLAALCDSLRRGAHGPFAMPSRNSVSRIQARHIAANTAATGN